MRCDIEQTTAAPVIEANGFVIAGRFREIRTTGLDEDECCITVAPCTTKSPTMAAPRVEVGDGSATVVLFLASRISVPAADRYSPTDDESGKTARGLCRGKR